MHNASLSPRFELLFKVLIAAALVFGLAFGMLSSRIGFAQDAPQTFVVQAGANGAGNIEALIFAPQVLNIHRGDTVTWVVNGFHDIRFPEDGIAPLALIPGVDDVQVPQINPVVGLPTIDNGATYTGGPANSGLPAGMPGGAPDSGGLFSLVMDLEPGSYNYLCDVHPGMAGIINVVDDQTAVASPAEVAIQGKNEIDRTLALGSGEVQAKAEAAAGVVTAGDDGVAHIQAGMGDTGRATINQYFGFTAVIQVGQSVTWTVPDTSIEPHTVTWPPLRGQDVIPQPQPSGPPILAFGPGFTPNIPENNEVKQGTQFNSALLMPGQTFTLKFTEAGVYPFVCNIHPAMEGAVIVQPAS